MSGVNSPSKEHENPDGVQNGTVGKEAGVDPAAVNAGVAGEGDDEESDDYDDDEEGDYEEERQMAGDEDDEEEEDEEGSAQAKRTLTSFLIGNPNAPVDGADIGDEEDEDEDEEEDDDEYVEEQDEAAPVSNKKRSIDEVADEEDAQGSKKAKS